MLVDLLIQEVRSIRHAYELSEQRRIDIIFEQIVAFVDNESQKY